MLMRTNTLAEQARSHEKERRRKEKKKRKKKKRKEKKEEERLTDFKFPTFIGGFQVKSR